MKGRWLFSFQLILSIGFSLSYNIDPDKILTFKELGDKNGTPMFGYSISLYKNLNKPLLIVGAPNASTAHIINGESQSGAAFICDMEKQECSLIEGLVNRTYNKYVNIEDGPKSGQWLGASVNSYGDGRALVCAPRYYEIYPNQNDKYFPVGRCYYMENNFTTEFHEVVPCVEQYCQAGISTAISKNHIFIGIPGYASGLGRVYKKDSASPYKGHFSFTYTNYYAYGGSSLALVQLNWEMLAIGAPRNKLIGTVQLIYSHILQRPAEDSWLQGEQPYSNFGHSLLSINLNNDRRDELLVSAPMFNDKKTGYDTGRVYIYEFINEKQKPKTLIKITGHKSASRFGTAMCSLGDINNDKFNDFAISAPYEDSGKVYIYHGAKDLKEPIQHTQVLEPKPEWGPLTSFGFSLSGGIDIDLNEYPDVAVGAYESNRVIIFKVRPIVSIETSYNSIKPISTDNIDCIAQTRGVACTLMKVCFKYNSIGTPAQIKVGVTWTLDIDRPKHRKPRVLIENTIGTFVQELQLSRNQKNCQNLTIKKNEEFFGYSPDIKLKFELDLKHDKSLNLQPILDQTPIKDRVALSIIHNCGRDNICIPDLSVEASVNSSYLYGDKKTLLMMVQIKNRLEDAFDPVFQMKIPPGFNYQSYNRQGHNVICSSELRDDYEDLRCDLPNPVRAEHGFISFSLTLTPNPSALLTADYELKLSVNSSNPENGTTSNNLISKFISIKVDVDFNVTGKATPNDEIFYDPKKVAFPSNDTIEDEIGPEIIHTYSVTNTGKSLIPLMEFSLTWPFATTNYTENEYFLYLLERPTTTDSIVCHESDKINVENVKLNGIAGSNERPELSESYDNVNELERRSRREVPDRSQGIDESEVECPKFRCARIKCSINSLEPGDLVQVAFRFRLVTNTLRKLTIFSARTSTEASVVITKGPLGTTNDNETIHEIVSLISPMPVKHNIPKLWVIILSADAGTLLLLGLIVILWKWGFFKRKKLPSEQDLKCAEYANQYKDKDLNEEYAKCLKIDQDEFNE
uniref:CSON011990 protein n=1 Tax=Culicoides sonorensis TaxID=179676 RepID=A0A336KL87_CULSO